MESKKINQLATELTPALSDLTIIGDPTTGISKKITLSQMASLFTGTVEEYPSFASLPLVGTADTIYITTDTNILYRWDTTLSAYAELSPNIVTSLVFSDANGFDGNISLVGSVATLTITTALTTGSVPFIGASGALSQDNANLFFDDTNNRLGINTNSPTTALDVFGSGIIGRINGTSTNNAFLGFASAGTNKWSIGNVQSDHRFRIYSEANTSELVSVLQTGEFGIGIANPTTKLHIDGGASALIANLDANVSVAKSISFRSDNSARINLEVSGTESGSNAGANFFIRRYSDAGALIDTPLTITRSTGAISLATALSGTSASFSSTLNIKSDLLLEASNSTNKWSIYTYTDNSFRMNYNGAGNDEIIMTSAGSFGIGVLPTTKFEVNDTNNIPIRFGDITAAPSSQLAGYIGMSTSAYNGINGDLVLFPRTSAPSRILLMGGKVGIGTSTVDYELTVNGNIAATNGGIYYLQRSSSAAILPIIRFWNGSGLPMTGGALGDILTMGTQGTSAYKFATDNTERLTITSNGYAKFTSTGSYNDINAQNHEFVNGTQGNNSHFIGNTNSSYAGATLLRLNCVRTTTNGTYNLIAATNGNSSGEFIVRDSGNCQNTNNSYTGTSDIKLKQDIIDASSQWEDIKQMRIRKFRFKKQVEENENAPYLLGVIAQELELVSPNLIDETPDFDGTGEEVTTTTKSVKYSIIYMKAVKALQEAMQKIEILEEKVKQLELK